MKCQICISEEAVILWRPLVHMTEFAELKYLESCTMSVPVCKRCRQIIESAPPDYIQTELVRSIRNLLTGHTRPN